MAQAINLQITPSNVMPKIYASQFDIGREIEISLYDGASAYTPPVGTDIRFEGKKPDGNGFSYACTYTGNVVTVVTTDQMTVLAGEIPCELRMSLNGDDIGTLNIIFVIEKSPIDENVPISDTEIPAIIELARDEQYAAEAWATGERNGVPVGPTDPQYHNNAKYWAEHAEYGALDDLTDVEITTPADGDLLQYNGTDDEWINSSDVWDTIAQNGAHNLWDIVGWAERLGQSYTKSGTTYTFNYVGAFYDSPYVFSDTDIDVVVSGTVGSATNIKARVGLYNAAGQRVARSEFDTNFTISGSGCKIIIEYNTNGQWSITDGMIRLASDHNTDYTPYAPTNRDCMSYAVNTKLGAHNFLKNRLAGKSTTVNALTFTTDENGVITASIGTASGTNNSVMISGSGSANWSQAEQTLQKGTYIASVGGGGSSTLYMKISVEGASPQDYSVYGNNEVQFTVPSDSTRIIVYLLVINGAVVTSSNNKFYPMIRLASDTDTTYEPYAMTNKELTKNAIVIEKKLITSSIAVANGLFTFDISVAKTGYKAIGVAGFAFSRIANVVYTGVSIKDDNTVFVEGVNSTGTGANVQGNVTVIYQLS